MLLHVCLEQVWRAWISIGLRTSSSTITKRCALISITRTREKPILNALVRQRVQSWDLEDSTESQLCLKSLVQRYQLVLDFSVKLLLQR